jgi:hypothetical protein
MYYMSAHAAMLRETYWEAAGILIAVNNKVSGTTVLASERAIITLVLPTAESLWLRL